MGNEPCISLIIPVFNEHDNLNIMVERIMSLPLDIHQVLFIDDGSTDGTLDLLRVLSTTDTRIQYISFSRNFGHQAALKAGFDNAHGDCVVTLDGDLQHPPELIPRMVEMWKSGADVVQSRRLPERGQTFFKRLTSKCFYKLLNLLSPVHVEQGAADFRLLDAKIVELCKNLPESTLFWRGIIPWLGFNQQYLDYTPASRIHGKSKYSMRKMLRLAVDGILSFSTLPLRFATVAGGVALGLCFIYSIYTIITALSGVAVPGWSSLMCVMLALGGFQLLFQGILGEYIGKIFLQSKHRYPYIVKEKSDDL